jgi:ubiquinone/menaquinone biosynthesis C-methylase UbiE
MTQTNETLARLARRPLYSQATAVYDRLFPRFDPQVIERLLAVCDRYLGHPPELTLDLGCGTGRYAIALAQAGLPVVGLDGAQSMLNAAAMNAWQDRAAVIWVLANALALPFRSAFDACLCRGVLSDLVGPGEVETALRECARVLRRNGLLLADVRESDAHARRYARQPRGRISGPDGVTLAYEARFDPDTRLITVIETLELPNGPIRHTWRMRTFRADELTALLESAGLVSRAIWGWYDQRPVEGGNRLAVLAQKP